MVPTGIDRRSQNLRHLYLGMGLQFVFFSPRSNNCDFIRCNHPLHTGLWRLTLTQGKVVPTGIDRRSQNLRHLYLGMGLQFVFFPHDQITVISSGAYVLRFERECKHAWNAERRAKIVDACLVGKNPNTPNWSSMADDATTRGGIGVLGSSFYMCGVNTPALLLITWTWNRKASKISVPFTT